MSELPILNDIPAILARAETWRRETESRAALITADGVILSDVPNMAKEILSLREEKAWLISELRSRVAGEVAADGREENPNADHWNRQGEWLEREAIKIETWCLGARAALGEAEAADAELSRREKANG